MAYTAPLVYVMILMIYTLVNPALLHSVLNQGGSVWITPAGPQERYITGCDRNRGSIYYGRSLIKGSANDMVKYLMNEFGEPYLGVPRYL